MLQNCIVATKYSWRHTPNLCGWYHDNYFQFFKKPIQYGIFIFQMKKLKFYRKIVHETIIEEGFFLELLGQS